MVFGLPMISTQDKVCEGCIYGKMHCLMFLKKAWTAKAPLELVHADIFGPTRIALLNINKYFILFVDDYSKMMWLYFFKQKSGGFFKVPALQSFGR